MDKQKIKQEIERIQQGVIDDMEESRHRLETAADLDENETMDPEDLSRQNELGNMATRLKFMLQKAKADLEMFHELPMDGGDIVKAGSLVETDSYVFYVGIAVHPFDLDGKHIVSISTDAPIYIAMHGKKTGDEFTVAKRNYKILSIQ